MADRPAGDASTCPTSGCRARGRSCRAATLRRAGRRPCGARAGATRLRPARRVRRPRAQREPGVPDRASTRASRRRSSCVGRDGCRPGDPGGQRVLRAWPGRRRCRCAAHLFQDLSLPGQPRDRSRPLAAILADEGIGRGSRVGVLGWKTYADRCLLEVPAFLVDELRALVRSGRRRGERQRPPDRPRRRPAGHQRRRPARGASSTPSCQTSDGVRRLLAGLRPGMTRGRGRPACWAGTGCRSRAT